MSDGTKRVKVVQNSKLPDFVVRSWSERLFKLPWKPHIKYKENNNAYYDAATGFYYVAPVAFKKISGKSIGPLTKFVSFPALKAICG